MTFKEVDTLFLAFGWIRQFFLDNGIVRIPDYLAFLIETCGVLYWALIFIFVVSLLVGYARQMSSFYFFYQYLMGQKLDNPYKPSIVIAVLWINVQIFATSFAMGGVYFIKYGVIVLVMVVASTILALLVVYVMTKFLLKKMSPKKPEAKAQTVAKVAPVQDRIAHQPTDPVIYLQAPLPHQEKSKNDDPQYMEALMILGLKPDFTKDELQAQYKKLIKKVHADKGGSDGLYLKVKQCYEFLLGRIS